MFATDHIAAPMTLEEAGLSLDMATQLTLKTLYFSGELSGSDLARRLGVAFSVIGPALESLKTQRYCEVVGASIVGGASYRYRITNEGRSIAGLYLQQNHYVGVAPVPLAQYQAYMTQRRRSRPPTVTREQVQEALSHLVLSHVVLDEIGPAINGGQSIFIYGPPGNGKTSIARALWGLIAGDIEIPHAIEVQGSIIRVFDPVTHKERRIQEGEDLTLNLEASKDRRWATCRRPMVQVGGELTLASLDLSHDPRLGYYRAPIQLAANGGMLVIDDFGRQRCAPRDLLNRWMAPLESGTDCLTLQSGMTFEVPFSVFVAFATNIRPSELVDEAFLRRVRYKVYADSPSTEDFARIFELCCDERAVPFDRDLVEQLLDGYFHNHAVQRRACQPRDLINQALLLAAYRGEPRRLTIELLEGACAAYFVDDRG